MNMRKYLQNYGWHFNKSLCNYAISLMKKNGKKLEPVSKEYIDNYADVEKKELGDKVIMSVYRGERW